MTDLLKNGTIYCNPISEFAKLDDSCRNDKDELTTMMEYSGNTILFLSEDRDFKNPIIVDLKNTRYKEFVIKPVGNLFCLFTLDFKNTPDDHTITLDEQLKEFGTHVVLINDSNEFAKRVVNQLNMDGIQFKHGKIGYKDFSKYTGKKSFFSKDLKYSYQNEYRLHLLTAKNEPYKINIGSIEDIAVLMETKDIKSIRKRNL
ncbi:MAG: hypothetical protein WC623_07865 [Pedobacter sp.]|uniref:hypothetical protein n=1 Tax=Pedobacter sp. TaxID=1411316 RepID=UPI003564B7C4